MSETIYEALRDSHETQRGLFRRLLRTQDPGERQQLFETLRVEMEAHEAAEERYLYAPMLMDDDGLDASRHALHEHHEIDELVAELARLKPSGDAWLEKARDLSRQVHHHLKEEEGTFFQVSGKILSDDQKVRLARKYRSDFGRLQDEGGTH